MTTRHRIVGVIASAADLRFALQMSQPPDLFELRLDCLYPVGKWENQIRRLAAPIIITARDPREGGHNNLPLRTRRDLLGHFLDRARFVDIELRSVRYMRNLLRQVRNAGVGVIVSIHDFQSTPSLGRLRAKATLVRRLRPAIFKVVTRTDSAAELGRLLQFAADNQKLLPLSVFGVGKLGALSRILLAQRGSLLSYTSLKAPLVEGQVSLEQFRRALASHTTD
jgi:3-dehydroquinate dehydratase type I